MRFKVFYPEDDPVWLKHVAEINTTDITDAMTTLFLYYTHPLGTAVANTRTIYYPLHASTWIVYLRGLELKWTSDKINLCTDTPPLATQWVVILAAIILVPVAVMVLLGEALYSFNWDVDFSSLRCRSEDAWKRIRGTKEQSVKSTHINLVLKTESWVGTLRVTDFLI